MLQTNPAALQNGSGGDEGKAAAAEGEAADGAQPPAKKAKTEVGFAFQSQCPFLVTAFWRLPTIEITDTFSTQLCWAQSLTVCSYGTCESPNVAVHSEGRRVFLCCVPTLEVQIWRRGQRRRGGNACRGAIQRRCASWTPSWVAAACARSGEAAVVPEKTRIVRKSTEVAVHAPMTCEDRLSVCAGGEAPEWLRNFLVSSAISLHATNPPCQHGSSYLLRSESKVSMLDHSFIHGSHGQSRQSRQS
jgi:hypothetical protein